MFDNGRQSERTDSTICGEKTSLVQTAGIEYFLK